MKTIIARFTELKENVAGTADSEFEDLDYNKVDKALKTVGVSLKDTSGQFRNLDEVFLELSSKWDTLDRNSQRYIATIAAGSRQQSRFIAMMEDYDRTMELVNVTMEAQGRADEQFAKNAESLQFKLQSLKTAWEQVRISFADSDFFKNIIDMLTKFINLVSKMDKAQLATIATIGITIGSNIIQSLIATLKEGTTKIHTAWTEVQNKAFTQRPGLKQSWNNFMGQFKGGDSSYLQAGKEIFVKNYGASKIDNLTNPSLQGLTTNTDLAIHSLEKQEQLQQKILANEQQIAQLNSQGTEWSKQTASNLREQTNELYKQYGNLGQNSQRQLEIINNKARELGIEKEITAEDLKQLNGDLQKIQTLNRNNGIMNSQGGQVAVSGLKKAGQAAVTTALMTALSGADLSTILKTTVTTALMALIPTIIQLVGPTLIGFFSGPAGLITLISAAVITAIVMVIKKTKEAEEAELKRLSNIKKFNEELQKENQEAVSKYKKDVEKREKTERYLGYIDKYGDRDEALLSSEEAKRLDEAKTYISENYEDAYEETEDGHFITIERKMDEILEEMRRDEQSDISKVYNNYKTAIEDERRAFLLLKNSLDEHDLYKSLSTARTIYGEKVLEGIDERLISGLDTLSKNAFNKKWESYFKDDMDSILATIEKNAKTLGTENARNTQSNAIESSLELQGWSEEAAKIASYTRANINKNYIDKDLKAVGPELIKSLSQGNTSLLGQQGDKVEQALLQLGYGEGADKGIEDLFSSGTNIVKWEKLSSEMQEAMKAQFSYTTAGGWSEKEFNAMRKSRAEMNELLLRVISAQLISAEDFLSADDQQFFEKYKDVYAGFEAKILDTSNKTFDEYQQDIDKIYEEAEGATEEDTQKLKDSLTTYLSKNQENELNKWSKARETLKNIGTFTSFDQYIWNEWDVNTTEAYAELFKDMDKATQKQVGYVLNDFVDKLSQKDWQILSALDLEDLSSLGVDGAENYIKQLREAGHSAEEATKIYNEYISSMAAATGKGLLFGKDSTNIIEAQSKEKFKNLEEEFKLITQAEKEMRESGFISQSTALEMDEAELNEYFTRGAKGYELLGDKAQEFFVRQARAAEENDKLFIKNQDKAIQQVENLLGDAELNDYLEKYFSLGTVEEREDMLAQLSEESVEYAAMIQRVSEAGYTSLMDYLNALKEGRGAAIEQLEVDAYRAAMAIKEHYTEATEKVKELNKELEELNKKLKEQQEELEEAEKKYQEAVHGSENYKSSLDGLVNYNNMLTSINYNLDKLKENIEDVDNIADGVDILNQINENKNDKIATNQAKSILAKQAMGATRATLEREYADYVTFNGDVLNLDFSYKQLDANDEIRKNVEELHNLYNSQLKEAEDADKEARKEEKERLKEREEYLKKYVDVQQSVVDILKDQAEEEVQATKDKYDALKEADSEYLDALEDAIQKQRDLRNQENAEEELAQKEKKLSLMQRDTSGANAKEIKQLEQDIANDREKLLDDGIDNIINNMKELYNKQAEARDAEIEYMESVTENAQYFSDWAQSIIDSWTSIEDMTSWFLENDKAAEDLTIEQEELYINDLKAKWTDVVLWQSTQLTDINHNVDDIAIKTNELLNSLTEDITGRSEEYTTIAKNTSDEAIKEAEKARDKIKEEIGETEKSIVEMNQNLIDAEKTAAIAHGNAMESMRNDSKSAIESVAVLAVQTLAEFLAVDLGNEGEARAFAEKEGLVNSQGEYSQAFIDAVNAAGGNGSAFKQLELYDVISTSGGKPTVLGTNFRTAEEAKAFADQKGANAKVIKNVNKIYGDINELGELSGTNLYAKEWKSGAKKSQDIAPQEEITVQSSNVQSKNERINDGRIYDVLGKVYDGEDASTAVFIKLKDGRYLKTHIQSLFNNSAIDNQLLSGNMDSNSEVWEYSKRGADFKANWHTRGTYGEIKNWQRDYEEKWMKYATGGIVDYTGPAWVDGTPSRPEAFLSAEDTKLFMNAAELFAMSPLLNSSSAQNAVSSSVGDTTVEININVESISDDYDVDRLIKRVEEDINEAARPTGASVILNKRV